MTCLGDTCGRNQNQNKNPGRKELLIQCHGRSLRVWWGLREDAWNTGVALAEMGQVIKGYASNRQKGEGPPAERDRKREQVAALLLVFLLHVKLTLDNVTRKRNSLKVYQAAHRTPGMTTE